MKTLRALRVVRALDAWAGFFLKGISVFMLLVLFILLLANVFSRYVGLFSCGWFDEIVELSFAYLVFFGAVALWRERSHFKLDWLENKIASKPKYQAILRLLINSLSVVFFFLLLKNGWNLMMRANDTTPIFKLPKKLLYACIPASAFFMLVYSLRDLAVDFYSFITRKK